MACRVILQAVTACFTTRNRLFLRELRRARRWLTSLDYCAGIRHSPQCRVSIVEYEGDSPDQIEARLPASVNGAEYDFAQKLFKE